MDNSYKYKSLINSIKTINFSDDEHYKLLSADGFANDNIVGYEIVKGLRDNGLIEGRKPNLYISESVAQITDQKSEYIKIRGIDDNFIQKIIIDYLEKFKTAKRADFENILLGKLPDILDINQKKNKIKNNLQTLKKAGKIKNIGKVWKVSNV